MNKKVTFIALIAIFLMVSTAYADQWAEILGEHAATSVQQTAGGGYVVAGVTFSFDSGSYDAWVLKLNADGSVAWQKTYGGSSYDDASSVQQTSDGGYIVAGDTLSFGAGNGDAWVLKLNADGSVAWQKTYGGSGDDRASSIHQTSDGGYIVAGWTSSFGIGDYDVWVLKLKNDGSVAWQKTYGGSGDDRASSIYQTSDGGYIVAGYTYSFGAGSNDAWILKLNADGSVAWQKTYGGTNHDEARSIQQTSDGGYIVAGFTYSFGAGSSHAWVLKLNADGSVAWQKTYGGTISDSAASIQQTSDGGYIVAGSTVSFGAGAADLWLLKLNADGRVAWQKAYGETYNDSPSSVQQTSDGGYIVAGYTDSFGQGGFSAWVLKVDSQGNILGCNIISDTSATVADFYVGGVYSTASVSSSTAVSAVSAGVSTDTTTVPAQICSHTPSSSKWQKTYGGRNHEEATSVQQTSDGGYIVAGRTESSGAGSWDAWVLKLNTDGTIAWQKTYGGSGYDEARSIQQTTDGGYVVAGLTDSLGAGSYDALVMKLNSSGIVIWQKTYGGTGPDGAASIQQTSDGGYIVAGYTIPLVGGNSAAWVFKLDSAGTVLWQKTYGGSGNDNALAIQQTSDGGYIVAGLADSFGAGGNDAWVLKLSADGTIAWQRTYGGQNDDRAYSIRQTSDGGYIVAGFTASFGAGFRDAWVFKLNANGTIAWQKTYGGSDYDVANSILQTADGGYIMAGWTGSFGDANGDAWLMKLSADGSIAWQKTYGGTTGDSAASIQQTSDGGYIIAGDTYSFGAGDWDAWVLKLDMEGGITGCGTIGTSNATPKDSYASISIPQVSVSNSSAQVASSFPTTYNTTIMPGIICSASYTQYVLDVYKEGSGKGAVSSSPVGITCGEDCWEPFNSGFLVTLTPTADQGSLFAGWQGACNASGQVTMNADKYCVALFKSIVDFTGTPRSGIAPLMVSFADLSSNNPLGWSWSFGDGGISALGNPNHTYTWPGTYPVSLTLTGLGGHGSITKFDYITVNCGSGVQAVRFGTPPSTWTLTDTIQSAYEGAADGNYIEPMSMTFDRDLLFAQNKRVTLKGGFDCQFASGGAFTTVMGSMTIGGPLSGTGWVTMEKIIIR